MWAANNHINRFKTTQKFIDEGIVAQRGLKTEECEGFRVMVVDGFTIMCTHKISILCIQLGEYELKDDFYVVSIGDNNVVLDIQWLCSLGEFRMNLQTMEMKFEVEGKKFLLRGTTSDSPKIVSFKRMERLMRHDQVEWATECGFTKQFRTTK